MQIDYTTIERKIIDWNGQWLVVKMTKHSYKYHLIAYGHNLDGCIQDLF